MVLKEIKILYKQTILGFFLGCNTSFFFNDYFLNSFGNLANVPSDGIPYPIFSYAALVPWTYFSTSLNKSTLSLVGNMGMLNKIYFPRLIIPFSPILSGLIDFAIAFVIVFLLMFWYSIPLSVNIVFIPLLIILMIFVLLWNWNIFQLWQFNIEISDMLYNFLLNYYCMLPQLFGLCHSLLKNMVKTFFIHTDYIQWLE